MDHKPCLECGGEVSPCPEFGVDIVWCEGCPGYKANYTATRAAIVSRVLAEAVKDAVKVEATTAWNGKTGVCRLFPKRKLKPGTYALIPVKDDKP